MHRPHKIGASDAKLIAHGSEEELVAFAARLQSGEDLEFNVNHRFLMDLGTAVEPVTMKRFNDTVTTLADQQVTLTWHQDNRVGATLDGLTVDNMIVEAKFHTGQKDIWELAEYYNAQLQHQMMLHGSPRCHFVVTFGQWGAFKSIEVEADKAFHDEYMFRLLAFIQMLDGGPVELPEIKKPKAPQQRTHHWTLADNRITDLCLDYIENEQPSKKFATAKADLKEAFPDDYSKAVWDGDDGLKVTMTRARNGAIRFKVETSLLEAAE